MTDLSRGLTQGLNAGTPSASIAPSQPLVHPATAQLPPITDAAASVTSPASAAPVATPTTPVQTAATAPAVPHATPIIAPPPIPPSTLTPYGSDIPRSPTPPPPPPAPTITTSGPAAPMPPGTAMAAATGASAGTQISPGVYATSGAAATGTGAALVSSHTHDPLLDEAVRLAYELLHASRLHPGIHWCVGIFKTVHGTETVVTSNDGASYIPPGVYIPRTTKLVFADPLLDNEFQATWFGWVNPSAIMVAYAAQRAIFDPNCELYALAATTDPGASSVLQARKAGVPHYQDCDSTQSPTPPEQPPPELDASRSHRLAVVDSQTYSRLNGESQQRLAWDATAEAVGIAMAGAEPLFVEVAPVIREVFGALAAGTEIGDSQWTELTRRQRDRKSLWMRPGYLDMKPSTTSGVTALYRTHHNIDRAVEALSLWRTRDYADIVYAARQVTKEAQLWPTTTSS
ncbi:MAG: hypothetical protein ACM4D3_23785 [Candidatus Sericytochromatia bacterium]